MHAFRILGFAALAVMLPSTTANGPGLPGLNAEHLFEPFTRGLKESSISGVGLGLALCRTIVSAHDGTIHAQRLLPHGVRFEIRLPLGTASEIELDLLQA